MVLVMFRPDQQGVLEIVLETVRRVHAQSPGAHLMLVCTRGETPVEGMHLEEHKKVVEKVSREVLVGVEELVKELNEVTKKRETLLLEKRESGARKLCEKLRIEWRGLEGGLATKTKAAMSKLRDRIGQGQKGADEVMSAEERELRKLGEGVEAVGEDLRRVQDRRGGAKRMTAEGGKVWVVESVNGDGESVRALKQGLVECLEGLPFMGEAIPQGWQTAKAEVMKEFGERIVVLREEVESKVDGKGLGVGADGVWEAQRFFQLLGEVKVHRDVLVPNLQRFMDLLKPLAHHRPREALRKMGAGGATECDEQLVPRFEALASEDQLLVQDCVGELEDQMVLREELLPHLFGWKELKSPEERAAAVELLEAWQLLGRMPAAGEGRRWVVLLRLVPGKGSALDALPRTLPDAQSKCVGQYILEWVPPGLFGRLVGWVLRRADGEWEQQRLEGSVLKAVVRGSRLGRGKGADRIRVEERRDGIEVESDNIALLKDAFREVEELLKGEFPGVNYRTRVVFRHEGEEMEAETGTETIGQILEAKKWGRKLKVRRAGKDEAKRKEELAVAEEEAKEEEAEVSEESGQRVTMREVLGGVHSGVCVCHRAHDKDTELMTELSWLLEHRSGDMVSDMGGMAREEKEEEEEEKEKEEAKERQRLSRKEESIRRCKLLVICLSAESLTQKEGLLELKWALEEQANGKPLFVVSLDPAITAAEIKKWSSEDGVELKGADGAAVRVGAETVRVLQKWLEDVQLCLPAPDLVPLQKKMEELRQDRDEKTRKQAGNWKKEMEGEIEKVQKEIEEAEKQELVLKQVSELEVLQKKIRGLLQDRDGKRKKYEGMEPWERREDEAKELKKDIEKVQKEIEEAEQQARPLKQAVQQKLDAAIKNMLYNITNPDFRAGADIEFDGRIVDGSEWFVISFPGIHKKHWDELIKKAGLSTCCVFFPEMHVFFGKHVTDPESGRGVCYCEQLYGGVRPWGCKWFERWVQLLLEGLAQNQQPIVLKQSKNHPLAKHPRRLGFSQEGEVAFAKRYLEQHKPGVRMMFQDVDRFDGLGLDAEEVMAGCTLLADLLRVFEVYGGKEGGHCL